MTQIIRKDGETITSLEIAEIAGKNHANLMRDIRKMEDAWLKINQIKFDLIEYTDVRGRKQPAYKLTKTESLYVATKFNDEARAKLVLRWEELEREKLEESQKLNFSDPNVVLQLAKSWKDEQDKRLEAEKQIKTLKPKAELMKRVLDSDKLIDVGQVSKILELPFGRNKLFEQLRNKGIFFSNRNEPKQEYVQRGYFKLKEKWIERNNHEGFPVIKVLATQKGLAFLCKVFEAEPNNQNMMQVK